MLSLREAKQSLLLFKLNENYELVDSLPYVDAYTDELKEEVKALVAEEMSQFEPRDYLAPLPRVYSHCEDKSDKRAGDKPLWLKGLEQSQGEGSPSVPPLDLSRYDVPEPAAADCNDLKAWRKVVDNAKAQLESSSTRLLNLELMTKHSQAMWQKHLSHLEHQDAQYKKRALLEQSAVESINKIRKIDQVSCGNELRTLYRDYEHLVDRNAKVVAALNEYKEKPAS